jgi:hypothetical protein
MNGPDALELRCPLLSRKQTSIGRRRKVGFLDLIPKSLRTNQADRSGADKRQRFDHPPPWALRRCGPKSDRNACNCNVCFNPMNRHHLLKPPCPKSATSGLRSSRHVRRHVPTAARPNWSLSAARAIPLPDSRPPSSVAIEAHPPPPTLLPSCPAKSVRGKA